MAKAKTTPVQLRVSRVEVDPETGKSVSQKPGQVIHVPEAEAKTMIERQTAFAVDSKGQRVAPKKPKVQTAAKRSNKKD